MEPGAASMQAVLLSPEIGIVVDNRITSGALEGKPIHASYGEDDAVFSIADGVVIEGSVPKNKQRLVQAWIEIHREDLMTDWRLALSGQNPMPIKPLE